MFNRPPGAMLSLGHTHQWRKGRNCSRVLSQHTAAIGTPTVTVCSIRAAGGTAFFFPKTERKPRMECGCQEVAFSSSCKVAPPGRFTRSRILAVLLPGRALPAFRRGGAPFLADLGLRADLAWEAAAWPFFAAALALWGGLGFPAAVAVAWAG